MCGIVGAISAKESTDFLLAGLSTLEYRGYDSAGLAVLNNGLQRARAKGRVAELASKVAQAGINGHVGIAHTRWATHGVPAERIDDPAEIAKRDLDGPFAHVVFDVELAPTDAAELQVRHARPRAKEDEQDLASQLAGTAKV